jgi:hypothetical protein
VRPASGKLVAMIANARQVGLEGTRRQDAPRRLFAFPLRQPSMFAALLRSDEGLRLTGP